MKQIIIALSMLCIITVKSYAGEEKVAKAVLESFEKSFRNASEVKWSYIKDLYKAEFLLDDHALVVWYNADGGMVALSRIITLEQLPLAAQLSFKNDFSDYTLANLFEIDNEEGNNYYAVVDNAKAVLRLRADVNGKWIVYEKKRK